MANSILTPSVITKEALMILHQKLNFVGNITRDYDDRYAQEGAKIGNDLKVRLPNEFVTRTGAALSTQDVKERSVTLTVDNQIGVDFEFDDEELTMHIDDFAARYLEPAMAVLAAKIESNALSGMITDVHNFVDGVGSANSLANVLNAGKKLTDNLAPLSNRKMLHSTQSTVDLVDNLKSLQHDPKQLSKQYKEGQLETVAGFEHFESTLVPRFTSGTAAEGDTAWNINNASGESASDAEVAAGVQSLTVDTGTTTLVAGDIITIDNVFRVHPETKESTAELQQFVVVGDDVVGDPLEAGGTTLQISPPIITSGGRQNVDAAAADNAAINKVGGGSAFTCEQTLGFHPGAFAFATADLVKPKGVHMCAREVLDGISLRVVKDYDISTDSFPCRLDVLYGYQTLRGGQAVRIGHNT